MLNSSDKEAVQEALVAKKRSGRPPTMTPTQRKEQARRQQEARRRAFSALGRLHPQEFRYAYDLAMDEIIAERGPLHTY